jgi:hypothetical protein
LIDEAAGRRLFRPAASLYVHGVDMLFISERALQALADLRIGTEATPDESLLLYLEEDGSLGLALAEIEEGDNVVEHDGQIVVIVADDLAAALDGMMLDVGISDDGDEVEFVIVEPEEEIEDEEPSLNGHAPHAES